MTVPGSLCERAASGRSPGFEFEVRIAVSAEGSPSASGSPNSALRRCLFDLITPRLSLGATATGGEFVHVFRRE